MECYIRFQTALRCKMTARPLGIFYAAGHVKDSSLLPETTLDRLERALHWFNKNLKVPSLDDHAWRSIFWFRSEHQRLIANIWELVAIMREEGIAVRLCRTSSPGAIIYQDAHQIAAVPRGKKRRGGCEFRC